MLNTEGTARRRVDQGATRDGQRSGISHRIKVTDFRTSTHDKPNGLFDNSWMKRQEEGAQMQADVGEISLGELLKDEQNLTLVRGVIFRKEKENQGHSGCNRFERTVRRISVFWERWIHRHVPKQY